MMLLSTPLFSHWSIPLTYELAVFPETQPAVILVWVNDKKDLWKLQVNKSINRQERHMETPGEQINQKIVRAKKH